MKDNLDRFSEYVMIVNQLMDLLFVYTLYFASSSASYSYICTARIDFRKRGGAKNERLFWFYLKFKRSKHTCSNIIGREILKCVSMRSIHINGDAHFINCDSLCARLLSEEESEASVSSLSLGRVGDHA